MGHVRNFDEDNLIVGSIGDRLRGKDTNRSLNLSKFSIVNLMHYMGLRLECCQLYRHNSIGVKYKRQAMMQQFKTVQTAAILIQS